MDFEVCLVPMKYPGLSEVWPLSVSSSGGPTVFEPGLKVDVGGLKEVESRPKEAQLSISSPKLLKNPSKARALSLVVVGGRGALEMEQKIFIAEGFDIKENSGSRFHSNPVFSCLGGEEASSSSSTLFVDVGTMVVFGLRSNEEGEDVAPLQMVWANDCLGIEGLTLMQIEDSLGNDLVRNVGVGASGCLEDNFEEDPWLWVNLQNFVAVWVCQRRVLRRSISR